MRKRTKLGKLLQTSTGRKKESLLNKIKVIEIQIKTSSENEERRKEKGAVEAIRENSRFFFKYAKRKATIG